MKRSPKSLKSGDLFSGKVGIGVDTLLLPVLLLILGLVVLLLGQRTRAAAGLPEGEIVYDDSGAEEAVRPLFSARYGLTGKPDYLLRRGGAIIPVEIKSGRGPAVPYESHVFQLIAYCLLVEEEYGAPPPYGVIRYADRAFEVDYTAAMKRALLLVLEDMRVQAGADDAARSHDEPHRCYVCGYRAVCDQRLVR